MHDEDQNHLSERSTIIQNNRKDSEFYNDDKNNHSKIKHTYYNVPPQNFNQEFHQPNQNSLAETPIKINKNQNQNIQTFKV